MTQHEGQPTPPASEHEERLAIANRNKGIPTVLSPKLPEDATPSPDFVQRVKHTKKLLLRLHSVEVED